MKRVAGAERKVAHIVQCIFAKYFCKNNLSGLSHGFQLFATKAIGTHKSNSLFCFTLWKEMIILMNFSIVLLTTGKEMNQIGIE